MIEIKNIYNRDINGIPSEDYWIQMQIQLEVCDLEYCDFLECKLKEYDDEEEYLKAERARHKKYYELNRNYRDIDTLYTSFLFKIL